MNPTLKWGLALAVLLGLLDIAGVSGLWADEGPPAALAIGGGVVGVITIVAAALARRRGAIPVVIGSRVVSALLGLPVYWADDAPDWSKIVIGIAIAVTVAAIVLLAVGRRAPQPA
ncbi:hypothetical protein FLW53_17680 [Microbispora sp. SCL1-1]|jgi:hypothetical protein|uniref:Integral membrane protein n=1 Tax=Microbispora hainanensis TaxID=568844 RepID=A0ABZ1SX44_9ACTN|nr:MULTISPECIES: hypothetical protein [Microbispora]NJP25995.1 hypothetical protein [Microbispora sp. CL1-1]TQS12775.1 hypothetical protein FLW53_17680 [Microbispora sp. SCL1-1]